MEKDKIDKILYTMEGDYINIIKTTFDFKFDLCSALYSMYKQNMETKRSCKLNKLLFNYWSTCNSKKAC